MTTRSHLRFAGAALALALLTAAPSLFAASSPPLAAIRGTDEALAVVPSDAASVALVRFNDLKSSPIAGKLFSDADHVTADGDAARFFEDANLNIREDVDTVVMVGLAPSDSGSGVLAIVSGRFDPERLGAAAEARGATKTAAAGVTYYLLPEKAESSKHGPTAAAFVSTHLVLGGTEAAVVQALAARAAGGTSFASGGGLGAQLTRVNRSASVWALVDVTRYPAVQKGLDRGHGRSESSETTSTLLGAMKSVTLFAFQATVKGDGMDLSASGVARDPDTRQLLEDSLRGVIAMWRLAVQDKSPELVPILRRFHVDSDGDAVTISGNLPSSVLKSLSARHTASR